VNVSYGLPNPSTDTSDGAGGFTLVKELAAAAEDAAFDAIYASEHPFPGDKWLAHGGHHAFDPVVALSFAAAATSRIRLHTNLFVASYRNPFLGAKSIATLDVLSGGRVELGIGTGYLEDEFAALGVPFDHRNELTDEALVAMKAAWSGESVSMDGRDFTASGNTMLPRPVQQPHPPIWIGGNSRVAIRRAVDHAQGWSPFPNPRRLAARTRTAPLDSTEDLLVRLSYAADYAASVGRTEPLDVMFIPTGLSTLDSDFDEETVLHSCEQLAAAGVSWIAVAFPGDTVEEQLSSIDHFGRGVLRSIRSL
jgi:probable F420-dependent oxidoreductase